MNLRNLFRRRPSASVPGQPTAPVWEQPGHFQRGQIVHWPPHPFHERVVWVQGDQVGVDVGWSTGTVQVRDIRHVQGCPPCEADAQRAAEAEEQREEAYWAQWPQEEHDAYDAAMDDMVEVGEDDRQRYRFGDRTPVREWLRTEFDGHLVSPESPSLSFGRIWDPLDWTRIEREHADDGFTITNPWGKVSWERIRAAHDLLRDRGYQPVLDTELEMQLLDDGTLGAEAVVSELTVHGYLDDETYEAVVPLLGDATDVPFSLLRYPARENGRGWDVSQPYTAETYTMTEWNWCAPGDDFNPPAEEAPPAGGAGDVPAA